MSPLINSGRPDEVARAGALAASALAIVSETPSATTAYLDGLKPNLTVPPLPQVTVQTLAVGPDVWQVALDGYTTG